MQSSGLFLVDKFSLGCTSENVTIVEANSKLYDVDVDSGLSNYDFSSLGGPSGHGTTTSRLSSQNGEERGEQGSINSRKASNSFRSVQAVNEWGVGLSGGSFYEGDGADRRSAVSLDSRTMYYDYSTRYGPVGDRAGSEIDSSIDRILGVSNVNSGITEEAPRNSRQAESRKRGFCLDALKIKTRRDRSRLMIGLILALVVVLGVSISLAIVVIS